MARKWAAVAVMVVIWGAVALLALVINEQNNDLWNAKVGYLLVALAVVAAWVGADITLSELHLDTPYNPE